MGPGHPRFEYQGRVGSGASHVRHALRFRLTRTGRPASASRALRSVRRRDDPLPAGCRCRAGMAVPRGRGRRRQHRSMARRPGGHQRPGASPPTSTRAFSNRWQIPRSRCAGTTSCAIPARFGIRPRARAPDPRPPPEREPALAKMVGALKPGGWLVCEEFDSLSMPANPALHADEMRAEGAGRHAARHGVAWRKHALRARPGRTHARPGPGRHSRGCAAGHVARRVRRRAAVFVPTSSNCEKSCCGSDCSRKRN